jgi:hypothetical protein
MDDVPQIDLSKIQFPSDELTVKAIRRLWPESVDTEKEVELFTDEGYHGGPGELLWSMLVMERDLARATFGAEYGREPEILYADHDVSLVADDLRKRYIEFGIASGQHHASQLIRGIESQASAQARQHFPPRP